MNLLCIINDSTEKKVIRPSSVGEDRRESAILGDVVPKFDHFRGKNGALSLLNPPIQSFFRGVINGFKNAHINTMNEQLNDAFEIYFPKMSLLVRFLYLGLSALLLLSLRLRKWMFGGKLLVNERIVEYPQIFKWIKPGGSVLDIGCVSSRLSIQLASLGYEVHGLDVRPYPFKHPNFKFHQEDLFNWNPQQIFDTILTISTIEHSGFGGYGDLVLPDADKQAIAKIVSFLSPGGRLLISVPFGKASVTRKHRIYDIEQLKNLFSAFNWVDSRYYHRINGHWMPCDSTELMEIDSPDLPVNGVVVLWLELNLSHDV